MKDFRDEDFYGGPPRQYDDVGIDDEGKGNRDRMDETKGSRIRMVQGQTGFLNASPGTGQ